MNSSDIIIGTIEIPVGDLKRALEWYDSALGMRKTWSDKRHAVLESGQGPPQLLLVETNDQTRLGFTCSKTGINHGGVDFRTEDLEAMHAHLSGLGTPVDPLQPPVNDWAPRGFGFEDTEGNRFGAYTGGGE